MQHFYERHVLHSLAICKFIDFKPGTEILDAGTGGGFPGIPLAIYFPECHFHLTDSIGKKIKVVKEVYQTIGLNNVETEQARVEKLIRTYDFVVSRAVTALPVITNWVQKKIKTHQQNTIHNGLLYLKGGEFQNELDELKEKVRVYPLSEVFHIPFFETKKMVHVEL